MTTTDNVIKYIAQYYKLPTKWDNEHLSELLQFYSYITENKFIPQMYILSNNSNCTFDIDQSNHIDFNKTWNNLLSKYYVHSDVNKVMMNIFNDIFFIYNAGLIMMFHNTRNNKTSYIGIISNMPRCGEAINKHIIYK